MVTPAERPALLGLIQEGNTQPQGHCCCLLQALIQQEPQFPVRFWEAGAPFCCSHCPLAALRVGGEWKSWGSPVFEPGSGAVSASSLDPAPPESMSVLPLMCQAMNSWFGKVWDVQCLLSAGWTQLSSLVTQYPFPLGCGCGGCLCS